jgi:hypothetical protein
VCHVDPGNCHCRNISFTLTWDPDPAEIPVRACTCSFCTKHGNVWTSNPKGALRIAIAQREQVGRYTFETRTAEFLVCSRCGIVPVAASRIDGNVYAVVNANTFAGIDPSLLRRSSVSFDGEAETSRLDRRKRNWIADVGYIHDSA